MEESKAKKTGGKREGQKYKSLLVWDILLKKTDENHAIRLKDIEEHLSHYGITAERHSIKRDIDDILMLLNQANCWLGIALFVEKQDFSSNIKSGIFPVFPLISPETEGFGWKKLIDIMEDDDDVQNVWHNWEE